MKALFVLTIFSLFTTMYAQCPSIESIHKEHLKTATKNKDNFTISSQSRTGNITSEKTYEMSFIAQPGNDYRLSTKAVDGSSGSISFEVYEMEVEKKTVNGVESYKRDKKVLATSANAGSGSLEFSTDKTRKIFVAVSISGGEKNKAVCVGVLIEDKKSTKLGL